MSTLLQGGWVVTHSDPAGRYRGFHGDLLLVDGLIKRVIVDGERPHADSVVDVSGLWLVPGFVQTHTHLVQALFRGMADDLALLDWLRLRIWPLEAAHDEESTYWSARLGITEMLLGGTTGILDMASVRHTDSVFKAAGEAGIRAHIGKAMMDRPNEAGLSESTESSVRSSCELRDRWHRKGLLRYAFAPRFVPSCTESLLRQTVHEARSAGCLIHSHASENKDEVELVESLTSMSNVEYLDRVGMTGPDVVLAHCIHLSDAEAALLGQTATNVAHCPGSNLKLASGIATTPALMANGVNLTLGADGAPCNNRMDMFAEMRLAALIQKPIHGAPVPKAEDILDLATINGARALGTNGGDILPGQTADIVALDPSLPHSLGGGPAAGSLVYGMTPANVRHVWVNGDAVVVDRQVAAWDWSETLAGCRSSLERIRKRAKL